MSYVPKERPTLGMMIRALRMGFGWCNAIQGFVRISGDKAPFTFEFHPIGLIPNSLRRKDQPHRKWWPDNQGDPGIPILEAPFLRGIRCVKRYFVAYLDDGGNPV